MAKSPSPDSGPLDGRTAAEIIALAAVSRQSLKKFARAIDEATSPFKDEIITHARSTGVDLPTEAATWPAKRLLRLAMGREAGARTRRNPIRRDEPFHCLHCDADIVPGGRIVRDHCPQCLRSLHVDVVPGDRAADCGGIMHPVGLSRSHGDDTIIYECSSCGKQHQVIVHPDDSSAALRSVTGNPPI
jgi:RNHCP domain